MRTIEIAGRLIGEGQAPYVIAEMSGNHNGSLERALAIVEAAKDAGADAVKLQTYTADTMTIDHDGPEFTVESPLWKGRTLYDLYGEAHTPWEWHAPLFARARDLGVTIFSSPFDPTAVDFLDGLGAPAFKIASFEIVDLPLIRKAASKGKPMILSTGMATLEEIEEAVTAARSAGCADLMLLHCVSAYPARPDQASLANIAELMRRFGVLVGLSDHTQGWDVPVAAVALGAVAVEKHVTLRRADGGVDSMFSLEPEELREMVARVRDIQRATGAAQFGPKPAERDSLVFRRSIYVVDDIAVGEPFTAANIRLIRPGHGLKPKHYEGVLGRPATRAIRRGEALAWDMVGDAPVGNGQRQ